MRDVRLDVGRHRIDLAAMFGKQTQVVLTQSLGKQLVDRRPGALGIVKNSHHQIASNDRHSWYLLIAKRPGELFQHSTLQIRCPIAAAAPISWNTAIPTRGHRCVSWANRSRVTLDERSCPTLPHTL